MTARVAGVAVSDIQQAKVVVPKVECVQDNPSGCGKKTIFVRLINKIK